MKDWDDGISQGKHKKRSKSSNNAALLLASKRGLTKKFWYRLCFCLGLIIPTVIVSLIIHAFFFVWALGYLLVYFTLAGLFKLFNFLLSGKKKK